MAGPEFFETRMGKEFYMRDIPEIRKQLKRILMLLEIFTTIQEHSHLI